MFRKVIATAAVLGIGLAAVIPASAKPIIPLPGPKFPGPKFPGPKFPGPGPKFPGPHPGWGWGLGAAALGVGFGLAAEGAYCTHWEAVYDVYGNYVGRQPVNVCQ